MQPWEGAHFLDLNETIVAKETVLEKSYSSGEATPADTRAVLDELARLHADLRYTHLSAHLAMRSVLSADQISKYDALRGYSDGTAAPEFVFDARKLLKESEKTLAPPDSISHSKN